MLHLLWLQWGCTLTDGTIINLEEFEGRSVSFQCSHRLAGSNNKYFCKDPCISTGDILLTVEPGRRAESGRIALMDSGDGSFTVTFSNLQLSDSQKYRCAVERTKRDGLMTEKPITGEGGRRGSRSIYWLLSLMWECFTNIQR
uniref:Immunoglobulin V-set domain-containing protein n=1 Tax=Maylandia zebra TaxID=106582 RepID=A0A3P9B719_9CICH